MMMKSFVSVLVVVALARVAAADSPSDPTFEPKDRGTAFELSIGGTAASLALVGAGAGAHSEGVMLGGLASLMITPSFGEMYAGQPVTLGMGVRAASAVAFAVGIDKAIACDGQQASLCGLGSLWIIGAAGYGAGVLIDLAGAGHAVDKYNAAHELHIAPTVMATPSGSVMGMGVGGRF